MATKASKIKKAVQRNAGSPAAPVKGGANDPQVVQTTNNWNQQAVNDKGYRDGVDYSLAIRNASSDADIQQLQAERQKKIDAVYGGSDPYRNVNTAFVHLPQGVGKGQVRGGICQSVSFQQNLRVVDSNVVNEGFERSRCKCIGKNDYNSRAEIYSTKCCSS